VKFIRCKWREWKTYLLLTTHYANLSSAMATKYHAETKVNILTPGILLTEDAHSASNNFLLGF
jgi:hypothetical protein